ncbi:MAG: tetratricopeptide repeat protein [Elainellaceae cyanobacterium]
MDKSFSLSEAVEAYKRSLQVLTSHLGKSTAAQKARAPKGLPNHQSDEIFLAVLTARDAVQRSLEDAKVLPAAALMTLHRCDQALKAHQQTIASAQNIGEWRSLTDPPQTSWWWHVEPPSRLPWLEKHLTWLHRFDALWTFLTLCFLTIAVTLFLNTLSRFADGGLDTFGTVVVVAQAILTIAGGTTALTKQGRYWIEDWLSKLRIPKSFWQEFSVVVALLVMLLVFFTYHVGLPKTAQILHQRGKDTHYESEHLDSALQYYQKAIALDPDFAEAHYNLGVLYESLQQLDNAAAEYQLVIQSNFNDLSPLTKLRAHNNLGRLYIIKGQLREAWVPLDRGLSFVRPQSPEDIQADVRWEQVLLEKHNLLKNLGWLRVEQDHFFNADERLREAIGIAEELGTRIEADPSLKDLLGVNTQPAAAYCLEAQALEGLNRNEEALAFWRSCSRYGTIVDPDEAKWLAVARERDIAAGGGN